MLSFLGFEILIVAMLHPGRNSSMSHWIVACSSLANVPYDRARLGSSLAQLRPRCADRGVLLNVMIGLRSNGSGVPAVDVLRRACETFNAALHLSATRAVGQTIIFLLAATSTQTSKSLRRNPLSCRPKQVHPQRDLEDSLDSSHPDHRQQQTSPHQARISGSGHRFRILGSIHHPANAMQCEFAGAVIPVPNVLPRRT
jgi:hypothetical protein